MRLPVRVRHIEDEAAYDLFRRLGAAMGQPRPAAFAAELGLNWAAIRQGGSIPVVAELADVDPRELIGSTFVRGGEFTTFRSLAFRHGDWKPGTRACPRCLHADRKAMPAGSGIHRRSWWDLQAISRCPEHGNELIERCSDCGSSILENGSGACSCGKDLVSASDPADDKQWAWDRYFIARLFKKSHRPIALLDELDFESLVPAVLALAGLRRSSNGPMAHQASVGFGFAMQGDLAIERATAGRAPFDGRHDTIRTYLNPLYSWLTESEDAGRHVLTDNLRRFARKHLPVTSAKEVLGEGYIDVDYVDRYKVQKTLGIDLHVMAQLYRSLIDPAASRSPNALRKADAERIECEFWQCISARGAWQRLHLSPRELGKLILLPDSVLPRVDWSSTTLPFVRLKDVVELEQAARADVPFVDKTDCKTTTMHDFYKYTKSSNYILEKEVSLNLLFTMLKRDKLKPVAKLHRHVGPRSLVFDITQLIDALEAELGSSSIREGD